MITIKIPNNNINERKYILDVIFNEFLEIDFDTIIDQNILYWDIELENGNKLTFEDHFFIMYPENLEYLNLVNIPDSIEYVKNKFIDDIDMPILYGNEKLNIHNSEILCGIDIFASSFFMLTRWEEYVNKSRDSHNRFPAHESAAYKNNFLNRPIVNEYISMLKNMLHHLDPHLKFKMNHPKLFLTHDVDQLYKWKSWRHVFRVSVSDLIKRKNISLAFERIKEYFLIKRKKIKDPFNTFDWLMGKSESLGIKSRFYFMSGGVTVYDNGYKIDEPKSLELIQRILERGHIIGIHPSYDAYKDFTQFKKEKNILEEVTKQEIVEGREHYLRFEVPTTWQIWEDNDMKWDSTLSFADKEGFRCGVCYEYSVFNILTRKKLNLREKPLIVMEGSFATYQPNINLNDMENRIKLLIKKVKKYLPGENTEGLDLQIMSPVEATKATLKRFRTIFS